MSLDEEVGMLKGQMEGVKVSVALLQSEIIRGFSEMKLEIIRQFSQQIPDCEDHSKRLRKLESWRWYVMGIVLGAMALLQLLRK